ncbi:putative bifunctional diguanylate cyclase/phosphodiesterase [Gordonibacter sp.]|uniref:putative bifunctional diguanylate cyclase/phosphodiesterase n=1 Tax=Gordonibacter sp. TaxID=1968902 RepID=UPI002FC7AAF2
MKRKRFGKIVVAVALWTLGAILFVMLLLQVQGYAGIINDAGSVRGGTQRVVKMELAGHPAGGTEKRVGMLLVQLRAVEEARIYQKPETVAFIEKLDAVEHQWELILDEIDALERGEGSREHLFDLSETHFELADAMVLAAQTRADHDVFRMGALCTAIFLLAALVMLFMRNDRMAKLKAAYYLDPVTKRKNAIAFEDQASRIVSNAPSDTYVVAYTNVSNFRYINEAYGYEAGSQLLRALARMLDEQCHHDEVAAHANADHFLLLLRDDPYRVERLCESVEEKLRIDPELHFTNVLSLGCGVSSVDHSSAGVSAAISNAIAVLKESTGDSAVARYDEAFRAVVELRGRIEQCMERALGKGEFLLYLQPKNNLVDGAVVGAEALCRWNSSELGFLLPDSFIPVFERNGFVIRLDFYMLEHLCRIYPLLPVESDEPLVVSVNFSRVTVLCDGFVDQLLNIVDNVGVPHGCIEIEATESAFVMDEDAVIRKLSVLKEKGFRLAMDDFGTGYSSLNLLRKLPIDILKIDRVFLSESSEEERSRSVLKGVVDIAADLGLDMVCEGVETKEQATMLHELGCTVGQGYAFSRPLPVSEFCERFGIIKPD